MINIVYLITARGGSKGVPRKNILEIDGLPLIAYKIRAAQRCGYKGRIIVSTDDSEIAEVSRSYGADVPFMRPEYLATDTASSIDVVLHAIDWLENNDDIKYEYLCLLEPSSPFATPEDLTKAIDVLVSKNADIVLGMKEVEVASCFIKPLDENGGLSLFYESIRKMKGVRRQDQKSEYTMNGCLYLTKIDYFKEHKMFHSPNSYPHMMDSAVSVEIDTLVDYEFAKYCVEKNIIDTRPWK